MECGTINYPGIIARITSTRPEDWRPDVGPSSGRGVDSWYRHEPDAALAYVNLDQEELTVDVTCSLDWSRYGGFQGGLSEFSEFVTRQPPA